MTDQNRSDRPTRLRVRWGDVGATALTAALCIGFGWNVVTLAADKAAERMPESSRIDVPTCATEDSVGPCFWDATRGNRHGRSFVVGADQVIYYLPESR